MVESKRHRAGKGGTPGFHRGARPSRDEVNTRVRETRRTNGTKRGLSFGGCVKPPHRLQHVIVKALHAERDPVDAAGLEPFKYLLLRIERMQFDRELARRDRRPCPQRIKERREIAERGRPTTKVNR